MSIKCLTTLLFHNDEDLVEDQIQYYKYLNKQDLIVFIHNSSDRTTELVNKYKDDILCIYELTDKVSFKDNDVHSIIYQILGNLCDIKNYIPNHVKLSDNKYINFNYANTYDWVSFPESDEFLEGPDRTKTYYEHLHNIHSKKNINKIIFDRYNFWFTEKDDLSIISPNKRIKYYAYREPKREIIYAWRGRACILRWFGHIAHNTNIDRPSELIKWKSRHYEIRSKKHLKNKINSSVNIATGESNTHYFKMYKKFNNIKNYGIIKSEELYYDDGISELIKDKKYDWEANIC